MNILYIVVLLSKVELINPNTFANTLTVNDVVRYTVFIIMSIANTKWLHNI